MHYQLVSFPKNFGPATVSKSRRDVHRTESSEFKLNSIVDITEKYNFNCGLTQMC